MPLLCSKKLEFTASKNKVKSYLDQSLERRFVDLKQIFLFINHIFKEFVRSGSWLANEAYIARVISYQLDEISPFHSMA